MMNPCDIQLEDMISNVFFGTLMGWKIRGILMHNESLLTIKWRREKLIILSMMTMLCGLEGDKSYFALRDLQQRWLEEDLRVNLAYGSNACFGVGVVGHARYVGKAMERGGSCNRSMYVCHDHIFIAPFAFHEYCNGS